MDKNYRIYHLDELHKELDQIDEAKYPEEAKVIREYISKGGYQYPEAYMGRVIRVSFTNARYKWTLVAVLAAFFLTNALTLLTGHLIALLPLTVQGVMLFMIFTSHRYIRALIKIWLTLLLLTSSLGLLSIFYATHVTVLGVLLQLAPAAIGLTFLITVNKHVQLIRDDDASKSA